MTLFYNYVHIFNFSSASVGQAHCSHCSTLILREINFGELRMSKLPFSNILCKILQFTKINFTKNSKLQKNSYIFTL